MGEGFCPYCGHQNPSDYRFCVQCRRALPGGTPTPSASLTGPGTSGTGASEGTTVVPDAVPDLEPPPGGVRWGLALLVIAVAVVAILAGLYLLGHFPGRVIPGGPASPAYPAATVDLCDQSTGVDCTGDQLQLPVTAMGATQNHTPCDPLPPAGPNETLWLNYTVSGSATGVVLPSSAFDGPAGFAANPGGFLGNSVDRAELAWSWLNQTGSNHALVGVPGGGSGWCVTWYDPPGESATITWNSDVVYTYAATA